MPGRGPCPRGGPVRAALYVLLGAVALAAAVLSFAALRDLALLCGFSRPLAWLLPVVVDAGAAAGTLVWLGGRDAAQALRFARRLALALLGGSIAANALSHGVAAYRSGLAWWVVAVACVVSGAAPAVLGAVVHLVALRGRGSRTPDTERIEPYEVEDSTAPTREPPAGGHELPAPPSRDEPDDVLVADLRVVDATRRDAGLGPLPVGDSKAGIRARYGVGWNRASNLRRAADTPTEPPTRPHLVRDGEAAG